MTNILRLDSEICYLISDDFLVVDLPVDEIDAAEEALRKGEPDKVKAGMVFKLNKTFRFNFGLGGSGQFNIEESPNGKKRFSADNYKALIWLKDQLEKRGFKPVGGGVYVKRIIWAYIALCIIAVVLSSFAHKGLFIGKSFEEIMHSMGMYILIVLVAIVICVTTSIFVLNKKFKTFVVYKYK